MNAIRTTYPLLGFWDTRQGGRAENQDSCGFVDTPHGLVAVVCDGMGGGPAGKDASTLAVQAIAEYFCNQQPDAGDLKVMMQNAIEHAHQAIISKSESHPEMRGMGSTVVAVLFNSRAAIVAHIGDSRLYQLRHGEKVFRTEDHSMVADMVRSKELTEEQARLSSQTNVITKALGGKNGTLADIDVLPYEKGDRFLLCTDGIWNALPEGDLVKRTAKTPSLAGAVDSVVLMADEIGRKSGNTHDNLTLALFETKKDSTTKVKMNRKAINIIRALMVLCCISLIANIVFIVNSMRPVPEKELLEKSKQEVNAKDSVITQQKTLIEKLRNDSSNLSDGLKIAKEEKRKAEEEKEKAEERETEAKNKLMDAQKVPAQNKTITNQVTKETVIGYLNQANNEKDAGKRRGYVQEASKALGKLSARDIKNQNIYNKVSQNLKSVSNDYGVAKKHIETQINELKKIK